MQHVILPMFTTTNWEIETLLSLLLCKINDEMYSTHWPFLLSTSFPNTVNKYRVYKLCLLPFKSIHTFETQSFNNSLHLSCWICFFQQFSSLIGHMGYDVTGLYFLIFFRGVGSTLDHNAPSFCTTSSFRFNSVVSIATSTSHQEIQIYNKKLKLWLFFRHFFKN